MGQMVTDTLRDFAGGVVTSGRPTRQGPTTATRGRNSILTNVGFNSATPSTRPGMSMVNSESIWPGALTQFEYRTVTNGVFTRRHVYVGRDGRIGTLDSDPGGTGVATDIAQEVFEGQSLPDAAVAKNLFFVLDETAKRKLRGDVLENWGIVRPATAPVIADGGTAGDTGVMRGVFQVRVTFVNSHNNEESSASDTSNDLNINLDEHAQVVDVTDIPVSNDPQVNRRRVYIRNIRNQTEFRLAHTIDDNVTTSIQLNVDTGMLVVLGPNTTENEPPPDTAKYAAWFNSYMFVADDQNLYWSKKNQPSSFHPEQFEPVGAGDGQKITGLAVYGDVLLVFKSRSTYMLSGLTPSSWRLRPLFTDVGCVAHRSIVNAGSALWWWSDRGPVKWDGLDHPVRAGELLLSDFNLNEARVAQIEGAIDASRELVLWTYPEVGETRNTRILPLSYRVSAFVSNDWDPMDIASVASIEDHAGARWVYFANYNGQVFRFGDAVNDGVPGGRTSGSFVASGAVLPNITADDFYTDGEGLVERIVLVEDANGHLLGRRRIVENTDTLITFDSPINSLVVGETYTYYIGVPDFEWATPIMDSERAFQQKRYIFAYAAVEATGAQVWMDIFTDEDPDVPKRTVRFTAADGNKKLVSKRLKVGAVGLTWQQVLRSREPNLGVTLHELGMRAELLTDNLG